MERCSGFAALLLLGGCVAALPVGGFVSASAVFTDGSGRQCQLVRRVGEPPGAPVTMVCLDADGVWRPPRAAPVASPLPPTATPTYTGPPPYTAPNTALPNAAAEPLRPPSAPPAPLIRPRALQEPQPNALGPPIAY